MLEDQMFSYVLKGCKNKIIMIKCIYCWLWLTIIFSNVAKLANFSCKVMHCAKSVQIRIFFLVPISCMRSKYRDLPVNICIQSKYRKIRTGKNLVFVDFSHGDTQRRIQNPVKHVRRSVFAKTVDSWWPLTIFTKCSIFDMFRLWIYVSKDFM